MGNLKTLEIIMIVIGIFLIFRRKYSKQKVVRSAVARYIKMIKMILSSDKNGISAMEYNDRYTIVFNIGEMASIGMVRLLKGEKKLIVLNETLELTDKEYENLLETLKPVL